MAYKDPWLGVTWKVYAVQGAGGPKLKPSGKEGSFTLNAVLDPASGQTNYYAVVFSRDDMPLCWRGLQLYPYGATMFPPPVPLLQPWTQSGDTPWLAAANAVRQGLNDSMARLEGVLNPGSNASNLTLVCVPNATTTSTPLLVLELEGVGTNAIPEDGGGGHGDN